MKLSELSYREYIALEVLPTFAAKMPDNEAAWRSFGLADAFMKQAGKENDKIFRAEQRAIDAETKFETLQSIHVNMGEDFASRIALTQIWEFLGVDNQTEAMETLRVVRADRP